MKIENRNTIPLSRIAEEIEHNGELFIPIERLEEQSSSYFDFTKHPIHYPRHLYIMLLEWGFDLPSFKS